MRVSVIGFQVVYAVVVGGRGYRGGRDRRADVGALSASRLRTATDAQCAAD